MTLVSIRKLETTTTTTGICFTAEEFFELIETALDQEQRTLKVMVENLVISSRLLAFYLKKKNSNEKSFSCISFEREGINKAAGEVVDFLCSTKFPKVEVVKTEIKSLMKQKVLCSRISS